MKLKDYVGRSRTIRLEDVQDAEGERLEIVYDPVALTAEEWYGSALPLAEFLARLVKSWTLTDDDGQPIGTDMASISQLSDVELNVLVGLIVRDKETLPKEVMGRLTKSRPSGG